ncbi:MAG: molybdate ABC transporter substrate-binding protein [Litorilinea sp.]
MRQIVYFLGTFVCIVCVLTACAPAASTPPVSGGNATLPVANANRGSQAASPDSTGPHDTALIVSAASDLIPAFEAIGPVFTAATGTPVVFNFGSSGLLAQQIEQGAPVDVYASANRQYVQELLDGGHVVEDSVAAYGQGRITLWLRADSALDLTTLDELSNPAVTRIAIANPEHAPYGMAARQALQRAGLWETLQPQLILGENVAATLQYVESGNVDVGIVALSLSLAAGPAGRWTLIPADLHDPIEQTLAVVTRAPQPAAAHAFVAYVNSDAGRAVMRQFGFVLPGEELHTEELHSEDSPASVLENPAP